MVLGKEFLAADKVGKMAGYITGKPEKDESEGIVGSCMLGYG